LCDIRWKTAAETPLFSLSTGIAQADKPQGGPGDRVPQESGGESVLEENGELRISQSPVPDGHCPLFGDFLHAQIDCFPDGVRVENRLRLGEFAYHAVVALHCVGGVDDPPDLIREFKEGYQLRPVFIPGFQDVGVLLVPFFPELLFGVFGVFQIDRAVNFFQVSADCFPILVGYKFAAAALMQSWFFVFGKIELIASESPVRLS